MRPELKRVLQVKLGITLVLWALPCLLLPPAGFRLVGLPLGGSVPALVLVRLLGGAYVALCVGYALAIVDPDANAGMRLIGIASNGLASAILWIFIFRGTLVALPFRGKAYLVLSAVLTAGLAVALVLARRYPKPNIAPGLRSATLPRASAGE